MKEKSIEHLSEMKAKKMKEVTLKNYKKVMLELLSGYEDWEIERNVRLIQTQTLMVQHSCGTNAMAIMDLFDEMLYVVCSKCKKIIFNYPLGGIIEPSDFDEEWKQIPTPWKRGKVSASECLLQLRIQLVRVVPRVWRRIFVKGDMRFDDFHKLMQSLMGWSNSKTYEFIIDDLFRIVDKDNIKNILYHPAEDYTLYDVFLQGRSRIVSYEYDQSIPWRCTIGIERIKHPRPGKVYPQVVMGKGRAPHEWVEGPELYNRIVKLMKDNSGKIEDDIFQILGADYDPYLFDKEKMNADLRKKNFGIIDPDEIMIKNKTGKYRTHSYT